MTLRSIQKLSNLSSKWNIFHDCSHDVENHFVEYYLIYFKTDETVSVVKRSDIVELELSSMDGRELEVGSVCNMRENLPRTGCQLWYVSHFTITRLL